MITALPGAPRVSPRPASPVRAAAPQPPARKRIAIPPEQRAANVLRGVGFALMLTSLFASCSRIAFGLAGSAVIIGMALVGAAAGLAAEKLAPSRTR